MPRCLRIGEEACGAAEVDERKREQEEVRSEVMREGVGSQGAGVLQEGDEADTILRKGEKRAQKIKWLLCRVNSSTSNVGVGTRRQKRNMAGRRLCVDTGLQKTELL